MWVLIGDAGRSFSSGRKFHNNIFYKMNHIHIINYFGSVKQSNNINMIRKSKQNDVHVFFCFVYELWARIFIGNFERLYGRCMRSCNCTVFIAHCVLYVFLHWEYCETFIYDCGCGLILSFFWSEIHSRLFGYILNPWTLHF